MANTTAALRTYFQNLGHKEINYFQYGPVSRILAKRNSKMKYPCLWLETPSIKPVKTANHNYTVIRNTAFVVLVQVKKGDDESENAGYDISEQIAFDIIAKMIDDLPDFDFNSLSMDAVSSLSVDNEVGWRVEFEHKTREGFCHNPNKFN